MAKVLTEPDRHANGGAIVRVKLGATVRLVHAGYAQRAGRFIKFRRKWSRIWGRDVRITRRLTAGNVEHQRAVANGSRHHMPDGETTPALTSVWPKRDATAGWLEAEQSAVHRGDTDGATAIGGMRHWQDTGATALAAPPDEPPAE